MASQRINLLDQANVKRCDCALDQKDCQQNPAPFITILSTADVYTTDVFTINVLTADVFTANAAGPREHKLWTLTVERHNYANKQRQSLWNIQAMFANKFQPTPKYYQQSSVISPLSAKAFDINLFEISVVVYKLLSRRKNHKTFVASLDKLNSLLADSQATDQGAFATINKIEYIPDKRLIDECLAKFL
jgi:hypothetical protein